MKLLAIDMDGTCLNSKKRISENTLQALKVAARHGIEVVPTTSRALSCLPHQLEEQKFYRYVISSNGARITDIGTGANLFEALLPLSDALALIEECANMGAGITAHVNNQFLLQGRALTAVGRMLYGRDTAKAVPVKDVGAYLRKLNMDVEEIQFFFFSSKVRERIQAVLAKHNDISIAYGGNYVEICSKTATKGIALAELSRHLNIAPAEVACIGDSANDLPMFESAGTKFAMGNAVLQLKERADYVLPSNDDDGVAEAVTKYLSPYF